MPTLDWLGKQLTEPAPADLRLEALVFPQGDGYPNGQPANHLFLGDNFQVMSALLPQYEGRIQLIYADPPFFTNRKFPARIGRGEDSRKPAGWQLSDGYQDDWESLDDYLQFLYERLGLMWRLLAPEGTLYLHLDWHANSYARLLLDEIFGPEHLINEIVWTYHGPSPIRSAFKRKHDTIYSYARGDTYTFNADAVREPYNQSTVNTFKSSSKAGFGKVPDLERGKVPEDWWYFPVVARLHNERTGYPTQKPEGLLERIVRASSNPGDLVADFFCGSGTTAVAAVRNGRCFLGGDAMPRAVHTTRNRLVENRASFSMGAAHQARDPFPAPRAARLEVMPDQVALKTSLELDYWEVDPDWDGSIFRSAAQAVRPVRSGEIPMQLKIKSRRRVCVRMVTTQGDAYQLEVQPVTHTSNGL